MGTETVDASDDEDADGYYRAKASTKKEKKRQEREAQRQVKVSKGCSQFKRKKNVIASPTLIVKLHPQLPIFLLFHCISSCGVI